MNPLDTTTNNLFYHLNNLNGFLFTIEGQLTNFEKLYKESIYQASFDISIVFSASSLVIRDLTEWTDTGFANYYSSGVFSAKGDDYFKLIKVLMARESAWTVAHAFEAFETFLKDVSAIFIFNNQEFVNRSSMKKFEADKRSSKLSKTDFIFWRTYIEYRYNKNREILKFLRKICPDISKSEKGNNRVLDLTEWFEVVEEVRNSATHSNFVIHARKMKDWSQNKIDFLNKYFSGIFEDKAYKLSITTKDATFCLELFSEYAFQIYKLLSISKGYTWDILKKKNNQ